MADVRVTLSGRVKLPTIEELVGEPLEQVAADLIETIDAELDRVTPRDKGDLRDSLKGEVVRSGGLPSGIEYQSDLPQGPILDSGELRGPGKAPPVDPIQRWVQRRGIASGKEARSRAFAIAKKIAKEGAKGPLKRVGGALRDKETKGWWSDVQQFADKALSQSREKLRDEIIKRFGK